MLLNDFVFGRMSKVNHAALAVLGHRGHQRIGRVEHGETVRRHDIDNHPLDLGQHFQIVDAAEAQMIAFADIGDDRHVAAVEAQAGSQHAAAGRFQHGHIDERIGQHLLALCGPLQSPLSIRRPSK